MHNIVCFIQTSYVGFAQDEKYAYEAQLSLLQVELQQKSVQSAAADAELATRPSLQEFQCAINLDVLPDPSIACT